MNSPSLDSEKLSILSKWRGCVLVGIAAFVLQVFANNCLDWFGPGKESQIFAYHPSFPDAQNFHAQRQKFLFQACRLTEAEYRDFCAEELATPSWENLPGLWLGALVMLVIFPETQVLVVAHALFHGILLGMITWHLWGFITTIGKACACIFLLPSFYLWASQLLRDPFLWLVFWIFLVCSQTFLNAPKPSTWVIAGTFVLMTGAWIGEEKRPLLQATLAAAAGYFFLGSAKTWKKIALVLLLFLAGHLGFNQMWSKNLSQVLFQIAALQDPPTKELKARFAEADLMPWQNIKIKMTENRIKSPDKSALSEFKDFASFASYTKTTLSGIAIWAFRETRGILDRKGWVWLCLPALDLISLVWILRGWFRAGPPWPRLHAMTFPLLLAGLCLCAVVLHAEHLGNVARNLAWFFLSFVFTLGSRVESAQALNRL